MNAKTKAFNNALSVNASRLFIIAFTYFITARLGLELAIIGSN
jgi:hypothetical protein